MAHRLFFFGVSSFLLVELGVDALGQSSSPGPVYEWSTLVGRASFGSENGSLTDARFRDPYGLAFDRTGNLYVADTGNHAIRRISPEGIVSTYAGSAGESGIVDGAAAAARFNGPQGVASDDAGNLYVADTRNHTIRMVSASGVVSTVAGQSGVAGNVDGPLATARLNFPTEIAVGLTAGEIFIHAGSEGGIRRIADGRVETVVAPSLINRAGAALQGAQAVPSAPLAVTRSGDLYFVGWDTDSRGAVVQVLMRRDAAGNVSTVNVNTGYWGPISGFYHLSAVADGLCFVSYLSVEEVNNYWVFRLDSTGAARPVGEAWNPGKGMSVDAAGNVFLTGFRGFDRSSLDGIARISPPISNAEVWSNATPWAGAFNGYAGVGGERTAVRLASIDNLAADQAGNLWATDLYRGQYLGRRFSESPVLLKITSTGQTSLADQARSSIRATISSIGTAVNLSGQAYFFHEGSGAGWYLDLVSPDGVVTALESGLRFPELALARFSAVDSAGDLVIEDRGRLRKRTPAGDWSTLAGAINYEGSPGSVIASREIRDGRGDAARFGRITGMVADRSGNIFVMDQWESLSAIRRVTADGAVTTISSNLRKSPGGSDAIVPRSGLGIDSAGSFFVAYNDGTIRRLDTQGNEAIIGGSSLRLDYVDAVGDAARFMAPSGLTVDAQDNIYVSDVLGTVIRKGVFRGNRPTISVQPASQAVAAGGSAQFTVVASGSSSLSYQWYFNGAAIGGATGSTLTLSNLAAANAGAYRAEVSNSLGRVMSNEAMLTVTSSDGGGALPAAGGGGGATSQAFYLVILLLVAAKQLKHRDIG